MPKLFLVVKQHLAWQVKKTVYKVDHLPFTMVINQTCNSFHQLELLDRADSLTASGQAKHKDESHDVQYDKYW